MHLTLQSQCTAGVALIRCQGRIVVGKEVELLQQEVEKHHLETQKYVLQLAEVSYLDSGGLGALVRLVGMLRAHRGDLKLCEVAPFVQSVLKATNLLPSSRYIPPNEKRSHLLPRVRRLVKRIPGPRIPRCFASIRPATCSPSLALSSSLLASR